MTLRRPTKVAIDAMREALALDFLAIRELALKSDAEVQDAWAGIETFCAISLRVMSITNPSILRKVMQTVEIQARMNGREVIG